MSIKSIYFLLIIEIRCTDYFGQTCLLFFTFRRRSEQQVCQLECDIKKLRSDLHSVRQTESEFRTQVNASLIAERYMKAELDQLKSDNENLQQK